MVFRRTKTSVTAWSVIREYMSKCSYGSLVTQKAIRAILEERAENYRKYGSVTTMNAYFNLMAGAGYAILPSMVFGWLLNLCRVTLRRQS